MPRKRMFSLATVSLRDAADDGRALSAQEQAHRYGSDDRGWRLLRIADRRSTGQVDYIVLSIRAEHLDRLVVMVAAINPCADLAATRSYAPVEPAWKALATDQG